MGCRGGGATVCKNEGMGWGGHTLMLEIASAFLVSGRWKSYYSQAHNGTLTACVIALDIKKELAITLTPCLFGGP